MSDGAQEEFCVVGGTRTSSRLDHLEDLPTFRGNRSRWSCEDMRATNGYGGWERFRIVDAGKGEASCGV